MTTRLVISMLLTVWAILIAAGVTAYLTTRSVLLANLDAALVARATPLNQSAGFVVKNGNQIVDSTVKSGASDLPSPRIERAVFVTADDGARVRSATVRVFGRDEHGTVQSQEVIQRESAEPFDRLLDRLAGSLIAAGCAGGLIAAIVTRAVARIALRPLHQTADTIGTIDERNLSRRIDASRLAPELVPVAEKLNAMLARLDVSFENRKRFLADASHELRTPVAALVTTLEVSLRRIRDADSYRQTMQTCLADARLLRTLVEALMQQARSEIGQFKEEAIDTDVEKLLLECVEILHALADEKGVALAVTAQGPMRAKVAPGRLRQAVLGLLENAIDHNRRGGEVTLSAAIVSSELEISVRDTGPGISPQHLSRIFEPFYRASASREAGGHLGLGLHLVKSHIDAMNGKCLVSSEPGKGSTFRIIVPAHLSPERPMISAVAEAVAR